MSWTLQISTLRAFKNLARLINIIITILIFVTISSAQGQETKSQTDPTSKMETEKEAKSGDLHLNRAYFKSCLTDTAYILSSPLSWDKSDWVTASLVVGVTVGLYAYDKDIQDWTQKRRGETSDNISRFARPLG
jgi:hypothetical protein